MSKIFAGVFAILMLVSVFPGAADASGHGGLRGGGFHGGGFHGGGFHGGGLRSGGFHGGRHHFGGFRRHGWGWPGPYYGWGFYGPSYYYYAPAGCGYVRMRVWRHGYWAIRRAWRCW